VLLHAWLPGARRRWQPEPARPERVVVAVRPDGAADA
jgi:hypothetical protein